MSQGPGDKGSSPSNVVHLGVATLAPLPVNAVSPAERGLKIVQAALVQQLGPVQAYNALVNAAKEVRSHITVKTPPQPPKEPTRGR